MKKYDILYSSVKSMIESGELKSGDKLLSVRKASEQYGVSVTTVLNAYFALCADGYIISKEKSGYTVSAKAMFNTVQAPQENRKKIQEKLTQVEWKVALAVAQGMENKEIAEQMNYSYGYVKNVIARIFSKLDIEKRRELRKLLIG